MISRKTGQASTSTLPFSTGESVNMTPTFAFGQPVTLVRPRRAPINDLFVLGTYPSALHVSWRADETLRVQALPIDNEPISFWTGDDRAERVGAWMKTVGWQRE